MSAATLASYPFDAAMSPWIRSAAGDVLVMATAVLTTWWIADQRLPTLLARRSAARGAVLLLLLIPVLWIGAQRAGVPAFLPSVTHVDATGLSAPAVEANAESRGPFAPGHATADPIGSEPSHVARVDIVGLGLWVWAAGAILAWLRLLIGCAAAARMTRAARAADPEVARACSRIAHGVGLRRAPRVAISSRFHAPACFSLPKPTILLPAAAAAPATRAALVAHECAHLAAKDPLFTLAQRAATALWWFHPLAHVLARRADEVAERVADRAAAGFAPSRSAYARVLLDLAEIAATAPARAFARAAGTGRTELARRVHDLLEPTPVALGQAGSRATALAVALGALVLLGCRSAQEPLPPRVLLLDVAPSWEFRYLKNALLSRADLRTNTLLLAADPTFEMERSPGAMVLNRIADVPADFAGFHVVVLSGVTPADLDPAEPAAAASALLRFVDAGGRLVLLPGAMGVDGLRGVGLDALLDDLDRAEGADEHTVELGQGSAVVVLRPETWRARADSTYEDLWGTILAAEWPGSGDR